MIPSYSFTVFGIAAPQGSKRLLGGAMVESSRHLPPWRSDVRTAAMQNKPHGWDLTTPMQVDLVFWFPRPATHYGSRAGIKYLKADAPSEPTSAKVGDIDKLSRAILDALTDVAYLDDRQVVKLDARKAYLMGRDAAPYTQITITPNV